MKHNDYICIYCKTCRDFTPPHKFCVLSISVPSTITIFAVKHRKSSVFVKSQTDPGLILPFRHIIAFAAPAFAGSAFGHRFFYVFPSLANRRRVLILHVMNRSLVFSRNGSSWSCLKSGRTRPGMNVFHFQETAGQWTSWNSSQTDIAHCSVVFICSRSASILSW